MKKVIYCLSILLCLLSAMISIRVVESYDQQQSYTFFLQEDQEVYLINIEELKEPTLFFDEMTQLCEQYQILILQSEESPRNEDKPIQKKYQIYKPQNMELNNVQCDQNQEVCQVSMLFKQNGVTLTPWKELDTDNFYITGSSKDITSFLNALKQSESYGSVSATNQSDMFIKNGIGFLIFAELMVSNGQIGALLLLLCLTIGFQASKELKKISLRKLYGYHWLSIWKEDNKVLMMVLLLAFVIIEGGYLSVQLIQSQKLTLVLWFLMIYGIITLILSLLVILTTLIIWCYCAHLDVLTSLHNEMHATLAGRVLCILKLVLIPIILLNLCPMLYFGNQSIQTIQNATKYQQLCQGYIRINFDDDVDQSVNENGYVEKVWDAFQQEFEVYSVNSIGLHEDSNVLLKDYGVETNTSYVNSQKLKTIDGTELVLAEEESYFILPNKYRNRISHKELIYWYRVSEDHILYIEDDQPLFLFDYVEKKGKNGVHNDYVIFVEGSKLNRASMYIQADEKELKECLKKYDLQEHITYQYVDDASEKASQFTLKRAWESLRESLFTFILVVLLLFSNLYFYFRINGKKIFVKLLFGYSLFQVFYKVLIEEAILLGLGTLIASLLQNFGIEGFYSSWMIPAAVLLFILDFSFYCLFLRYFKTASITQGLKGDQL